jgi:hypothetical protein
MANSYLTDPYGTVFCITLQYVLTHSQQNIMIIRDLAGFMFSYVYAYVTHSVEAGVYSFRLRAQSVVAARVQQALSY